MVEKRSSSLQQAHALLTPLSSWQFIRPHALLALTPPHIQSSLGADIRVADRGSNSLSKL